MKIFRDLNFVEHLRLEISHMVKTYGRSIFKLMDHVIRVSLKFDHTMRDIDEEKPETTT
jgi:hypothetical protein